jgi:hypothetical protein
METTTTLRNHAREIIDATDAHYTGKISGNFDFENTTDEEWLDIIRRTEKYGDYLSSGKFRFLKKIRKIATNIKRTKEYILVSSFRNIMINREETVTEIVEGEKMQAHIKDPYDFDYHISPKDIAELVKEKPVISEDDEVYEIRQEKMAQNSWRGCLSILEQQEIFSVSTHDSSKGIPPCPHCKGKGFFKCEECEGSGREQYVDGYYASGEERIKTGQCSHCYGKGKIECEVCGAAGKAQIYSDKYQIIRRFIGKKTVLGYDCLSSTDGDFGYDNGCRTYDDTYGGCSYNVWPNFEDAEIAQCVDKLYKHRNNVITDNNGQLAHAVLAKTGQDYSDLYEKNKKAAYNHWEEAGLFKGQVGCALEYHVLLPAVKICCTNKLDESEFEIFIWPYTYKPYDKSEEVEEGIQYRIEGIIHGLTFWESLFL